MKQLQIYQIDAFTDQVFHGNPAAVCPLEEWLEDGIMQGIALENNLSETAFFIPKGKEFHIRWFTPTAEVPLCGHATLASAFVIFTELEPERQTVLFESKSGPLGVTRKNSLMEMDFPAYQMTPCQDPPDGLFEGLKINPREVGVVEEDPNYYVILKTEEEVREIVPDLNTLACFHPYGVVVTGPGDKADIVSRYFAPSFGIPEDPATGSIHSALIPYWADRLGKPDIHALQASQREGDLYCRLQGDRVRIGGNAVKYLTGTVYLQ